MGTHGGYWLTRLLLQRGLGFIYLVAFLVVVNQFRPLCGERGLLPASRFMQYASFRDAPSIFFLWPKDGAFAFFGWCGVLLAVLATTGLSERFGTLVSMAVWLLLWLIYLSFVNIGQTFYAFGWESILLESGFLAIFLGAAHTEPKAVMIWLFRWVLFRVILGAGLIKLRGDPCWRDLTCLDYHFESQPMPNPLSWYFHWLPGWLHKGGVLFNHLAEVVAPFFYFAPQPLAASAGVLTVLFQGSLIVSGNFSWLNYLTLILAFSAFNDEQLGRVLPLSAPQLAPLSAFHGWLIWCVAILVAFLSIRPVRNLFSRDQVMNTSYNPYHLVNTYGAFGSITRERFEIVVEGTDEAALVPTTRWQAYEFRGKPGDLRRLPPQVAPYHLRLDWLMWFAAMPSPYYDRWFIHLLAKLLVNDTPTIALLQSNPFPVAPPRYVRALHYRYRFTSPQERRRTGCWWQRELAGTYFPPVALDDPAFRATLNKLGF
jgi:hypothetical protein